MKVYGHGSVADFLGEFIVYRNLIPMDARLQDGVLPGGDQDGRGVRIPRKLEPEYAQAMVKLLSRAHALDQPGTELNSLLYIGDTRLSDGGAFSNLCDAGGWNGFVYIGEDSDAPAEIELENSGTRTVCIANRWRFLNEIWGVLERADFQVDEHTAVIIDLDKTALGARGRNAKVIDQVRIDAAREMVRSAIGEDIGEERFNEAYHLLNAPHFHPLTADNQDYLAYICLVIASGFTDLGIVTKDFEDSKIGSFSEFLADVNDRKAKLSGHLSEIHASVFYAHQRGDPTPFKQFRQMEYLKTVERMGEPGGGESVEEILEQRICITQEVRTLAESCRERGALLFGLSDKPDEASLPTPEGREQGCRPIHHTVTIIVGS